MQDVLLTKTTDDTCMVAESAWTVVNLKEKSLLKESNFLHQLLKSLFFSFWFYTSAILSLDQAAALFNERTRRKPRIS